MTAVLNVQSTVSCPHNGRVTVPIASQARLSIGGLAVLPADVTFSPIVGCTVVTSASSGTAQCLAVSTVTAGQATKLSVGTVPVLLDTLAGMTAGMPPAPPAGPPLTASAGQTRLKAV